VAVDDLSEISSSIPEERTLPRQPFFVSATKPISADIRRVALACGKSGSARVLLDAGG